MLCNQYRIFTFMHVVRELAAGSKHYNQIIEVAESLDMYMCEGKDPIGALNVLLSLRDLTLTSEAEREIGRVIRRALEKYNKINKPAHIVKSINF